jgi:MFS family permease
MAWLAAAAPPDRRGELLGAALGAAVGGALFGPVVGAAGDVVGTGPAFATAAVAGGVLMVIAFFVPGASRAAASPQGLRDAWPVLRDPQMRISMWLTMLAGLALGVVDVLAPLRLNRLGATALVIGGTFLASAAIEAGLSPVAGRQQRRAPAGAESGAGVRVREPGLGERAGRCRRGERCARPGHHGLRPLRAARGRVPGDARRREPARARRPRGPAGQDAG